MLQKLACRMGMGESGNETIQVSAPEPCGSVNALSFLAMWFALSRSLDGELDGVAPSTC